MPLPILQDISERPREEYLHELRTNVKAAKDTGISNLGKPAWLTIRPPSDAFHDLRRRIREIGLVTVCQESHCPNMSECWSGGTATFMVLGDTCTRACKFCAVKARGQPEAPDASEPEKLVRAVGEMKLDYVVITAVDRDDLADGGAAHFARCIQALKRAYPGILIEVLIGDFQGNEEQLKTVVDAKPTVIAHNLETVRRLTPHVRDRRAGYEQTLAVLQNVKRLDPSIRTKSSIMTGLGETREELLQALDDLRDAGCDIVTFGQYLQPSTWHLPVERYMHPDEFKALEQDAREKGFLYCAAGPFVRSSYRAAELFLKGLIEEERKNGKPLSGEPAEVHA